MRTANLQMWLLNDTTLNHIGAWLMVAPVPWSCFEIPMQFTPFAIIYLLLLLLMYNKNWRQNKNYEELWTLNVFKPSEKLDEEFKFFKKYINNHPSMIFKIHTRFSCAWHILFLIQYLFYLRFLLRYSVYLL